MKLEDALSAHAEWKFRLRRFIDGGSEKLSSAVACRDDQCELGKWMQTPHPALAAFAEFGEAKAAHAEFHRRVGEVVRAVEQKDPAHALALLGPSSKFERASTNIGTALVRLRRAIQARAA